MSALRRLGCRLLHALQPSRGDGAAAREYDAHLALVEDDLVEHGLAPREARRVARQQVGMGPAMAAAHRDARGLPWLTDAARDLRHAWRMLRRAPAHTVAVLLTIALVVAMAATVSALVHGVLFTPLPWPDADRLVQVWETHEGATPAFPDPALSGLTYHALRDATPSLETALAVYEHRGHTVRVGNGAATRVRGAVMTPSMGKVLGMTPARGRWFTRDESTRPDARVAVISHRFWQRELGGRADVVGAVILVDGQAHEIVGVAPAGFAFPTRDTDVYRPLYAERPEGNNLSVSNAIARLPHGVTATQAAADWTAIARTAPRPMVADVIFGKGGPVRVHVEPLRARMTASVRPALLTLAAAIVLLLVVAAASVTTLAVAHAVGRQGELGVRISLGATRARLWRQVLLEHAVLCLIGALAGLAAGAVLLGILPAWLPESFPRVDTVRMRWSAAAVAAAIMTALAACAATAGVREVMRVVPAGGVLGGTRGATARRSRVRDGLLVAEAALALVLLVGAGLLLRSFAALVDVDAGYDRTHALTATVYLAPASARADDERSAPEGVADAVLARLRRLDGVTAAGIGQFVPFGGSLGRWGFEMPGTAGPDGRPITAYAMGNWVSDGYVEALGMRVVEGRALTAADRTAAVRAMLVNETFARTYLTDGGGAVGRRFTGMLGDDDTVVEVVGIVGDVRPVALDAVPDAHVYMALGGPASLPRPEMALALRLAPTVTEEALDQILRDVRAIVSDEAPDGAVEGLGRLDAKVMASVATPRAVMLTLVGLASLALALAVSGLGGVLSHRVTARARELGIRAALGATRRSLVAMVVREGLGLTVAGLAIGVTVAAILARLLSSQLYGVRPLDAVSFVSAAAVLIAAALLACIVPARQAARSDPAETLRRAV